MPGLRLLVLEGATTECGLQAISTRLDPQRGELLRELPASRDRARIHARIPLDDLGYAVLIEHRSCA
jgi:hypothetical protein